MKSIRQQKEKEKEEEEESVDAQPAPNPNIICVKCIVLTKEEKYLCKPDHFVGYVLTHFLAILLKRPVTEEDKKAYYLARPDSKDIPLDYLKRLYEVGVHHNDTLIRMISCLLYHDCSCRKGREDQRKGKETSLQAQAYFEESKPSPY